MILRFEDDTGAVRLDLNTSSGFQVESWDAGEETEEQTWLKQTPHPGAVLAATRTEVVTMGGTLIMLPQASVAAMEALMFALLLELARPTNVVRWAADGGGEVVYNTYKSPSRKSLYRAQGGIIPGTSRLYDPAPIPIVIPRDPTPRSGTHV